MLPIYERTLAPGVVLRAVQTNKFKTSMLGLTFLEPLQEQTASLNALLPKVLRRGTRQHPDMESLSAALDDLYGGSIADLYDPTVADPVKWFLDDDVLQENTGELIAFWLRMLPKNFHTYAEAFLEQNLPYFLPYADMIYRFDLGVVQMHMYPITEYSYFPDLREVYLEYDETLTLFGIPGLRLLSDMGFQVWLSIAMLGLAVYRKSRRMILPLAFLLALWLTCLLGPVAIIRYLLAFFYAVPVLLAYMIRPKKA